MLQFESKTDTVYALDKSRAYTSFRFGMVGFYLVHRVLFRQAWRMTNVFNDAQFSFGEYKQVFRS